jgi:hypothetical protein
MRHDAAAQAYWSAGSAGRAASDRTLATCTSMALSLALGPEALSTLAGEFDEEKAGPHSGWRAEGHSMSSFSLCQDQASIEQHLLQPCYEYECQTGIISVNQASPCNMCSPAQSQRGKNQSVGRQASTTQTWEPKALLDNITSWLTGTDGLKQAKGRNPAAPDVHSQQRTKNAALEF